MEVLGALMDAFTLILQPDVLMYVFFGVLMGIALGILLTGIALGIALAGRPGFSKYFQSDKYSELEKQFLVLCSSKMIRTSIKPHIQIHILIH